MTQRPKSPPKNGDAVEKVQTVLFDGLKIFDGRHRKSWSSHRKSCRGAHQTRRGPPGTAGECRVLSCGPTPPLLLAKPRPLFGRPGALFRHNQALALARSAPLSREEMADLQPTKRNVFFVITSSPATFCGGSCGTALNSTTRRHPRLGLVAGSRGPTQIHIRGLRHWAGEPARHLGAESPSRRSAGPASARKTSPPCSH